MTINCFLFFLQSAINKSSRGKNASRLIAVCLVGNNLLPELLSRFLKKNRASPPLVIVPVFPADDCAVRYAAREEIQRLIPLVDLWFWDFKASRQDHPRLTGVDADRIRNNLLTLDRSGTAIILRCPWIPGVYDSSAYREELLELSSRLKQIQRIELEPYNPLGEDKYARLGKNVHCSMPFPAHEAIQKQLGFHQKQKRYFRCRGIMFLRNLYIARESRSALQMARSVAERWSKAV